MLLNIIDDLLTDLDSRWTGAPSSRITLRVFGSAALFLQTTYNRGTTDSDVIETSQLTPPIRTRLLQLAGRDSPLHKKHRIYLDIVAASIPLLPPTPLWHHYPLPLNGFDIQVLDITDVILSKLKRWNSNDRADARAMIEGGHVDHGTLVERLRATIDHYKFDGRSDLLPDMAARLNQAEADWFLTEETPFEFPEETFR